jgi:hypothetical protein
MLLIKTKESIMAQLITPQSVQMWLTQATGANHIKLALRETHCTDNVYWASNGFRFHMTAMTPMTYNEQTRNIDFAFNSLMAELDLCDVKWHGNIPAMNLWTGADFACSNCPEPENNPTKFKGYYFNPQFVKDALLVMNGLVFVRLLVDPDDTERAMLHIVRDELSYHFEAIIMNMIN